MRGEAGAGAEAEGEGARARPLSGGLWTLFSWLRRDDRSSSSDSLSSAGSDRTAASFAYLAPPTLRNRASPLPPLAPPTDSYRKRVHDGNLRRQHDRNLTLHRKYGLYYGYDAFSLPPARKLCNDVDNELERDRRANSESLPRRAAFVPGKRRAPLPPSRPHSVISTASLTRRHNRKRPAPQPPIKFTDKNKENTPTSGFEKFDIVVQMNSHSHRDRYGLSKAGSDDIRSEKHSKKESNSKEPKIQKEKRFLKQIFENKKRNSTIESVPERILPSISELDKQAAEIIESCKLKPIEHNNNSEATNRLETWFCTRCLRRYDSTIVTCEYCLPEQKRASALFQDSSNRFATSSAAKDSNFTQTEKGKMTNLTSMNRVSGIGAEEKQKLKEMLKEMKDSLPKKSKRNNDEQDSKKNVFTFCSTSNNSSSLETPTLRIESKAHKEVNTSLSPQPSTSKQIDGAKNNITEITKIEKILPQIKSEKVTENVVITQHVVLVAPDKKEEPNTSVKATSSKIDFNDENKTKENDTTKSRSNVEANNIHIPLKISSLLNPVYIPRDIASQETSPRNLFFAQNKVLPKHVNSQPADAVQSGVTVTSSNVSSLGTSQLTSLLSTTDTPKVKTLTAIETKNITEDKKCLPKKAEEQGTKNEEIIKVNEIIPKSSFPSASSSSNGLSADTSPEKINNIQSNMTKFTVDQHSRRRDLINQLEQSIAKGDERAAADAAVKLAQLRLSCSVLSFTSQIMAQSSSATPRPEQDNSAVKKPDEIIETTQPSKVNTPVQLTANGPTNVVTKSKCLVKEAVKPEKKTAEVQTKATSTNKPKVNENKEKSKQNLLSDEPSTSKQISNEKGGNLVTIQVWVEDREATRGPVRLRIPRQAVMGDLRRQAEYSLGLVGTLQRWIVGRALCTDDRSPLISLAGPDLSAPFYLCVVETDIGGIANKIDDASTKVLDKNNADKVSDVYSELVQLEQRALVVNAEPFECGICMEDCAASGGAVLRECVHMFCRKCLSDLIKHCEEPIVGCPAMGCPGVLQEREIRSLVTQEEYERWLARGLTAAESGTRNAFHCRTRDCTGWALCDPGVRRFPCPVCKHKNCIPCEAIHEGETCEQYRLKLQETASTSTASPADEGTQALLETLITKGEALECPECRAIITKKWGCDWVKCSACKTEICWVTRGRRWGPAGKGDTSGGCRCGVDGKRCHPSCGYCH